MRSFRSLVSAQKSTLAGLALAAVAAGAATTVLTYNDASLAQDVGEAGEAAAAKRAAPKPAKKVEKHAAPAAHAAAAPAPAAAPAQPDFAAKLKENGAGACAPQINATAVGAMEAVNQFNTASHWAKAGGDRRLVAVSMGQRYAEGAKVPFAATNVVAAPNGKGGCDAVAVQVIPSPLSCAKLRESLSARGQQVADLAGVPLMQDPNGQTMLIPTAAETCVLVGIKVAYAQ